jgi:hypothetical protein
MNWSRVVLGGVVAGVVMTVANFVMHGMILSGTYVKYPQVFAQEGGGEPWFAVIGIVVSLVAAIAFGKSRGSWADGWSGGATFGALLGLTVGFVNFYWPIVLDGFPYYLSWCWLGVDVIAFVLSGAVLGVMIKKA